MDKKVLEKLHSEQLEILLAFNAFCEQHSLEYFLEGGSTLGAMRHQGFIPWDDDIDVGMFRNDYERLIALSDQLPPDLILRTPHNTPEFPGMFAKLCRKDSFFLTQEAADAGFQQEIFIDIFVYDQLAADAKERKRQLDNAFFWQSASYLFSSPNISVLPRGLKGAVAGFGARAAHRFFRATMDHKRITDRFERSINRSGDGSGLYITLSFPRINALPKECFFPTRKGRFEGYDLPVPNLTERYLENLYGDWRKLPAVEDQHMHDPLEIRFPDGEIWKSHETSEG